MKRIKLLVTGQAEKKGLHSSLEACLKGVDVKFEAEYAHGFTSTRVGGAPSAQAVNLAKYLVEEVGTRRNCPDFVIAIDDLELVNMDQPDVVVQRFCDAVEEYLRQQFPVPDNSSDRLRKRLRERCSFHLLKPMLETYLLSDPGARKAMNLAREPRVSPIRDPESPEYLDDEYFTFLASRPRHDLEEDNDRKYHPKLYTSFLCDREKPRPYRETKQGVAGLRNLDWRAILNKDENKGMLRFARSLFCDLCDMIGEPQPDGHYADLTWSQPDSNRLLRNIQ